MERQRTDTVMTDMKYWIQLVDRQHRTEMLHNITLPITPAMVKMTAELNITVLKLGRPVSSRI